MLSAPISITSLASISPLGKTPEEVWENYQKPSHKICTQNFEGNEAFAAVLPAGLKADIEKLRKESTHFKRVDLSVLYAIFAAKEALKRSGWANDKNIGVNIGSSRGATGLFEKYHREFLENGKAGVLASPTTTLGNISSWVSQYLESEGPSFSHSVTCSTGLHSILNAVAWLQAGLANKFMAGASEAALTAFSIAQMQAMKVYATEDLEFPCQALNLSKDRNSMILGEGSAMVCLERGKREDAQAYITGIGYATEELKHSASISEHGDSLQKAMKMALGNRALEEIDAVVTHTPGTIKGDRAEVHAVRSVFSEKMPALTCNKWKIGHTFATSGMLSLEFALLMLQHQQFIPLPFGTHFGTPKKLEHMLVNAIGFGGNAVSICVSKK